MILIRIKIKQIINIDKNYAILIHYLILFLEEAPIILIGAKIINKGLQIFF